MRRPRHATIVAYLALFVALGGTSYAATTLKVGSVGSREIRNGSIKIGDLAPSARPLKTNSRFRTAVAEVVNDPASGIVTIKVSGEKGDKGDPGASVAGPPGATGATGLQGDTGATGSSGPQGVPGDVKAFGHVKTDGSGSLQGATYTHPGLGVYCVNASASGVTSIIATPDAGNAQAFVLQPGDPGSSCLAGRFTVVVANNGGVDTGFFLLGN